MYPQSACPRGCIVTLVALVWLFPTVCFQMPPQIAFPRGCIFIIHIRCICLIFPHCVFSSVSSNNLLGMMHTHIGCICLTFLRHVLSNVSSNCLHHRMHSHTDCIFWLFSTVSSQMCPQIICPRWCIITLAAFIWLFLTVLFQMFPQITSLRGKKSHWLHLCDFVYTGLALIHYQDLNIDIDVPWVILVLNWEQIQTIWYGKRKMKNEISPHTLKIFLHLFYLN